MGLIKTNRSLSIQYKGIALNEATSHVEWVNHEGRHSIDIVSFCCEEILNQLAVLIPNVNGSINQLPGFPELYHLLTTDNSIYVEQMRGIIACI